ncbi:armadillo-like helical domain containing protein 1 [Oscarella lobularis]|uniref:armadillo-like helical domain containing protein 1 n=1 Tax=Oscarella lobularis TaxID=121494 RepID=UPI003313CF1F
MSKSVQPRPSTAALQKVLREWDQGSKIVRQRILRDFIHINDNKTAPELENEFANAASLFLTRLTSWLRLTYLLGTCLQLQIKAIGIFIGSSSGYKFLNEFIEVGGIMTVLEILGLRQAKEEDKAEGLRLLLKVANSGRKYKELICESYGVRSIAECLARARSEVTQDVARILLLEIANGNPRYQTQVYKSLIALLPAKSHTAQQMAAKTLRIIQPLVGKADPSLIEPTLMLLRSYHLSVQHEACELIIHLIDYEEVAQSILTGLVALLRPSSDERTSQPMPAILADESVGDIQAPLPIFIQQAGGARVLGALSRLSQSLSDRIINLRAVHNLLFAMGNRHHSDSQRQAAITLQYLIDVYPVVGEEIRKAIGNDFYSQFVADGPEIYVNMTDIQADILASNRVDIPSVK